MKTPTKGVKQKGLLFNTQENKHYSPKVIPKVKKGLNLSDTTQQLKESDSDIMDRYESYNTKQWKAYEDGKKEALEDELKFLETLPQQSGKTSLFQRTRVKQRITEIKQKLGKLK